MREVGFSFNVRVPDIDESFPENMDAEVVPVYLAQRKAEVFTHELTNEIVLASDTVVILDHHILNKPADREDAIRMINMLSGRTHQVITGFCLGSRKKTKTFAARTLVSFKQLSQQEIERYIDKFKPYDKAGSYGAQECLPPNTNPCSQEEIEFLRSIGKYELIEKSIISSEMENRVSIIEKIEGSYFNVMGLPIHRVYQELFSF